MVRCVHVHSKCMLLCFFFFYFHIGLFLLVIVGYHLFWSVSAWNCGEISVFSFSALVKMFQKQLSVTVRQHISVLRPNCHSVT